MIYSSAQVGILGAIIRKTNVEKILQINCNATDFYQKNSFPTYLYYNPYDSIQTVCFHNKEKEAVGLYDALSFEWINKEIKEEGCFTIPAKSARLVVVLPAGSNISRNKETYLVGTKVVAYAHAKTNKK